MTSDNEGEAKYNAGLAMGIRDYMTSTHETFPDHNWELLGLDSVDAIERIRKDQAVTSVKGANVEAAEKKVEGTPLKTAAKVWGGVEACFQETVGKDGGSLIDPRAKTPSVEKGDAEIPLSGDIAAASPTKPPQ